MKTLGLDIGSSSIKVAILDVENGNNVASLQLPQTEMPILSLQQGWAEQDPDMWWDYVCQAIPAVLSKGNTKSSDIAAIGISYQMHGLVCLDKNLQSLRNSIIWCDSRAVSIGEKAFMETGSETCLSHLLNSPGNFTLSKLAWVMENEPFLFEKIHTFLLPGDYIALKLTGEATTTVSGLSEGIMWDFSSHSPAEFLFKAFGIPYSLVPPLVPQSGIQGYLLPRVAAQLGLMPGIPVAYRAGDQPNNAFSLNVLNPGEVAATAGTSGVVYGISDMALYDPQSRVNTFVHVNHTSALNRLGVLLCINGTGILNSWMRKHIAGGLTYDEINREAASVYPGSEGIVILPFGNGSERMLGNRETGCIIEGVRFNNHSRAHLLRASQEGIAFAFRYGMEIMEKTGIDARKIRAGNANMFLSPVFRETLSTASGTQIQLYQTDGATGAARAAALGAGLYNSPEEAFSSLKAIQTINPDETMKPALDESYRKWRSLLEMHLNSE